MFARPLTRWILPLALLLPRLLLADSVTPAAPAASVPQPSGAPSPAPVAAPPGTSLDRAWAQWRGPQANGWAPHARPPIEWSETQNVRWKIPLPGKAHSTPILFGPRLFTVAAVPVGEARPPVFDQAKGTHDNVGVTHRHQFVALAYSRAEGKPVWQRTLTEEFPHEGGHATGSLASHSPITDGERLFVFLGSRGLFALDLEGKLLWKREFGRMNTLHAHGEGSSPVLWGKAVIVCWDHEDGSFLQAVDQQTGRDLWKVPRDEKTSWATPLLAEHAGRPQLITSASKRIRSYDPADGRLIWECAGLTDNVVSSPVHYDGLVIAGNSYYSQAMLAVRLAGAQGDVTGTDRVAWRLNRMSPYVPSPLVYGDTLYVIRHLQNVLSRFDPATGQPRGEALRLNGIGDLIFASPVGAAGRIYVTGRDGVTVVLRHDRDNAVMAVNRLDDQFSASAALMDRELYLRGERFLYCLAEP